MKAYIPFLLPLVESRYPEVSGHPARSPLDEETIIRTHAGKSQQIWELIQEQVEAAYGLPLLTGASENLKARPFVTEGADIPGERAMEVQQGPTSWFLMEHPDGLRAYDHLSDGERKPALAKPSLFARLWRQSSQIKSARDKLSFADQNQPGVALVALQEYVNRLLAGPPPSDWHLEPTRTGYQSRLRIDGALVNRGILSRGKGRWLVNSLMTQAGIKAHSTGSASEGVFPLTGPQGEKVILRLSNIPSVHGDALVIRFLFPDEQRYQDLSSLGFNCEQLAAVRSHYALGDGLWLLAGPTGSGKSTTLHALLQQSVKNQEKVLAIEDPVEIPVPGALHLNRGSPPGLTFTTALRAFLRQAPDTILIGEIRDGETAEIALQAARTGHRVLSSIHAMNNEGLIRRFADWGQPLEQLNSTCRMVIHQRLIPLLCPFCKFLAEFPLLWRPMLEDLHFPVPDKQADAKGCNRCLCGIQGRVAVFSCCPFPSRNPVSEDFLREAFSLFRSERVSFPQLIPFFPNVSRECFQLCQA